MDMANTFLVTDGELRNSPSRKDGIDEKTETALRNFGCELIQETGILLKESSHVRAMGQVLFHRFYCKNSFLHFNVKRVAATCLWLALREVNSNMGANEMITVIQRMECKSEGRAMEYEELSKKHPELMEDMEKCEQQMRKEMAIMCRVEDLYKLIREYTKFLESPQPLVEEAAKLGNDSFSTTLCVRVKTEVVACGIMYAAARRVGVPLPENPPWWLVFDGDKEGIDEVCLALATLYTLPKAEYIPVCLHDGSFTLMSPKEDSSTMVVVADDKGKVEAKSVSKGKKHAK